MAQYTILPIEGSAIDGRTVRDQGYESSQRKVIGLIRQVGVQGLDRVDQRLTLTMPT